MEKLTKKLDPTDRDIIRCLDKAKMRITPNKIAKAINVHPTTVQNRLKFLDRSNITNCKMRGNRRYCKVNSNWKNKIKT